MKKLILFLAFGLTGVFAHASTEAVSTNDEAAIIGGVGAFTAVNISLQLLHGVGVQVGIDKLTISAVD